MIFYIIFNIVMAIIFFLIGFGFYKSKGKAVNFLTGYNMSMNKKRKNCNEDEMCKEYGKRMMFMAVPFLIGIIIDFKFNGIGSWITWGIWIIMFILLLVERSKIER